jgi:uncharacterized protein YbcC (UPF0753/DUF2309 family)
MNTHSTFDEHKVLHELKHYLPAQAPLKDFIHHNTLHAFQHHTFYDGLRMASEIFGYRVSLSLKEYRSLYESNQIRKDILERIVLEKKGPELAKEWLRKVLYTDYKNTITPRIGTLRSNWKRNYKIDLDSLVHPILFRVLCSYLDQGISIWGFPVRNKSFIAAIREMEKNTFSSFFKKKKARNLLLKTTCEINDLLKILVGNDESLYEHYLFDQQFAHQGWSGMVSTVEDQPQTLLDSREISIHDLIVFELLLEIDALDTHLGGNWIPLGHGLTEKPIGLFNDIAEIELHQVWYIWQEAYEWSYYDQVLAGLTLPQKSTKATFDKSFQAMFCIDDRECSLRRHLEKFDPRCETFGTPGFFGVEFFYQPEHGKFYTKLCPAPVHPKYLIKEVEAKKKREIDVHFSKHDHSFYGGWLISQTLGFWSAFRLFLNIFRPTMSPATASSFRHMDKFSKLTIENKNTTHKENGLQIGFTIEEMANRVEGLLKSIGLVKDFASIIYVIGHGSSSVNNPHFAAYDCGACSGRAGSVNSRVVCHMANHPVVRETLKTRGLDIPSTTQFIGGLHDTTRDEIVFFDEHSLTHHNLESHNKNEVVFANALDYNAKERSRRFDSINTKLEAEKIHNKILIRSVSLFEPRPELNHATNTLCIVGRRSLTKNLFLDRRSFLNSYDYAIDPQGDLLLKVMKPLGPVCGGINLEYFFSRVDVQKLGAGSKLPHNVMGLFGVANGIDGDLRPGLPYQMTEVHDPIRLLIIVEHFPEVVLQVIQREPETYEWFINDWVKLVAVNPNTRELFYFNNGDFLKYKPLAQHIETTDDLTSILEATKENISVYQLS